MKHFSILNRAYTYYRGYTRKDKDSVIIRNEFKQSNVKLDCLKSTKLNIKIEDDWIIEIEEGIRHVADAVGQERQFIATIGEVIPIEKVKRVSRASIVHLAKHSDLISRLPEEGEILIPDKVYMEEKVSDFTVYENRFLYTLLIFTQQFVNMRQEKINETIRTYRSELVLNKDVLSKNYNLTFELKFNEERFDVLNNLVDEQTTSLIERIDMISREIISLLACPLMKDVSKAPLVKAPLVKTNVLKNNKNFKAAVLLYDFITSCDKDGYEIEEINESFNPFSNEISDDYAELVNLTSFISYKHGNRQGDVFKQEILEYELELEKQKNEALVEKIDKLKNKLIERDISIEEYVLMLEKRNTELESENESIEVYKKEIDDLEKSVFELNEELTQKDNYINNIQEEKEIVNDELTVMTQKYEEELLAKEEAVSEYEDKIENLSVVVKEELRNEFEEERLSLLEEFKEKENELNNSFDETKKDLNDRIDTMLTEHNDFKSENLDELTKTQEDLKKALNDKSFAYAQLLAMRIKNNIQTQEDDYTSKERFKELEEQYFIFESFFSEEWKRTKKKLRKQYLSNKK